MLKKILIGALAAIVITAIGFSVYNVLAKDTNRLAIEPVTTQSPTGQTQRGNGQAGQGQRQTGNGQENAPGYGIPNPQNGLTEWVTVQGVVSNYTAPNFTLTTTDGQAIAIQLGNLNYLSTLGLSLKDGDSVTLTGYYDSSGSFAVGTLTLDATGQTFTLRDEAGRPAWRGNGGRGQGSGNGSGNGGGNGNHGGNGGNGKGNGSGANSTGNL
jgi:hypothetical protein